MKISEHDKNVLAESRLREALEILKKLPKKTVGEQSHYRNLARRRAEEAVKLLKDG